MKLLLRRIAGLAKRERKPPRARPPEWERDDGHPGIRLKLYRKSIGERPDILTRTAGVALDENGGVVNKEGANIDQSVNEMFLKGVDGAELRLDIDYVVRRTRYEVAETVGTRILRLRGWHFEPLLQRYGSGAKTLAALLRECGMAQFVTAGSRHFGSEHIPDPRSFKYGLKRCLRTSPDP